MLLSLLILSIAVNAIFAQKSPHAHTPLSELSERMAEECVKDETCRAKYAIPSPGSESGVGTKVLAHDISAILLSHGFSDETCSGLLRADEKDEERARSSTTGNAIRDYKDKPMRLFLTLAKDLHIACADPVDVADSKAVVYTTGMATALLMVAIVAFVALFVVVGTKSDFDQTQSTAVATPSETSEPRVMQNNNDDRGR